MSCYQAFLAVSVGVFVVTLVGCMILVRRRGHDPKGVTQGKGKNAPITAIAALLWLVVSLAYVLDARSVDWFGRIAWLDSDLARGMGAVLCAVGILVTVAGEATLGECFRVALPREETRLVTRGVYGWIRNPCVVGADLLALGTLLIAPSLVALVALAMNIVGYHLKIRFEEEYLQQVFGAEYEAYRTRTGRYSPRLGRRGR